MAFSVDLVRDVAQRNGYVEIFHNEVSRMISFRNASTRINVYYTTATVGTCLNHPQRGKTQLFRRDVDRATLESIFAYPRVHTGTGYYRKHSSQKWKLEGASNTFVSDSARRWQYVGTSSGLFLEHPHDIQTVMEICTEWDNLYWDEGDLPDFSQTNYACGSHGGLVLMMYQVMNDTCGVTRGIQGGNIVEWNDMPFNHTCHNMICFMQDHGQDVARIHRKMESLSRDVKIELMQWLIGRECAGMRFVDRNDELIETNWSSIIELAHIEYGEMAYAKKAGLCPHCGVVYTDRESPY